MIVVNAHKGLFDLIEIFNILLMNIPVTHQCQDGNGN